MHALDSDGLVGTGGSERIVKDYAEAKRFGAEGGGSTDTPQTDDSESLSAQPAHFGRDVDFPAELFGFEVEGEKLSIESEGEGEGVVGDLLGTVIGHVADGDACLGGSGDVDRIKTDPVADDGLAVRHLGDYRSGDERAVPENQGVGFENLGGNGGVKIEPDGGELGDVVDEGPLDGGSVVGEAEFFGAEDDDRRAIHEKRFDPWLRGCHGCGVALTV